MPRQSLTWSKRYSNETAGISSRGKVAKSSSFGINIFATRTNNFLFRSGRLVNITNNETMDKYSHTPVDRKQKKCTP